MNDKTPLPIDKINKLAEVLKDQGLTEIELESDGLKIKVRQEFNMSAGVAAPLQPAALQAPLVQESATTENHHEVKSPMVGTFYSSPSPDADAFVKLGDKVSKGDTLCIVEAMKLMNELPADASGEIVEICVNNGDAISYGQVIMKIKAS